MSFLDFLFPKKCLGCGQKGRYFCQKCVPKIESISRPICPICVKPSPFGQAHPRCQTKYTIDGLTSVFVYKGIIRESIKQLKYNFRFDLAEELVTLIPNSIKVSSIQQLNLKRTMVVPIPLHRWRQDWRGFNQAVILARILSEKLDLPFCEDLLIRNRYTQPQTGLKKEERKKNVEEAFEVNKQSLISLRSNKHSLICLRQNEKYRIIRVNPRAAQEEVDDVIKAHAPLNQRKSKRQGVINTTSVLLFDDVWTTGATMKVCANLLKRAGFEKVWGLTVAR